MKDVIVFSGGKVLALNQAGSVLSGFPVAAGTGSDLAGSPVVADIDGDGSVDVAGVTSEGIVFAFGRDGRALAGFPLQAGPNDGVTPAVFYTQSGCLSCADIGLAVATGDGMLYAWKTGQLVTGPSAPPVQPWPQFAHDARNSASEDTVLGAYPAVRRVSPARAHLQLAEPGRRGGRLPDAHPLLRAFRRERHHQDLRPRGQPGEVLRGAGRAGRARQRGRLGRLRRRERRVLRAGRSRRPVGIGQRGPSPSRWSNSAPTRSIPGRAPRPAASTRSWSCRSPAVSRGGPRPRRISTIPNWNGAPSRPRISSSTTTPGRNARPAPSRRSPRRSTARSRRSTTTSRTAR